MSDMMKDLTNYYKSDAVTSAVANKKVNIQQKGDNTKLDMTSFIQLMITQLTNQGIDESVDTSDMLNQMIQMQMVETMANLTDASVMSYAASLVGKEVTVGQFDADGKLQEIVGKVTGTGTMNGQQVVFVGDKYYYMNEIMAVGHLPKVEETKPGEGTGEGDKTEGDGSVDGSNKPEGGEDGDKTEGTGGTESGGSEDKDETADPGAAEQ